MDGKEVGNTAPMLSSNMTSTAAPSATGDARPSAELTTAQRHHRQPEDGATARSRKRGAAGGGNSKDRNVQTTLSAAGAVKLDALRASTVGLLTRHLEAPLLMQVRPRQTAAAAAAAGASASVAAGTGNGMTDTEAAVTATFFHNLAPEALALYGDPSLVETARRVEQAELCARYTYQQPLGSPSLQQQQQRLPSSASSRSGPGRADISADTRSVDDRITSQALHLLLGKSRTAAERRLPHSLTTRHGPSSGAGGMDSNINAAAAFPFTNLRAAATLPRHMQQQQQQQLRLQRMHTELPHREPPALVACAGGSRYYYPTATAGSSSPTPMASPTSPASLTSKTQPALPANAQTVAAAAIPESAPASYHPRPPAAAAESLLRYPPIAGAHGQSTARRTVNTGGVTSSHKDPPSADGAASAAVDTSLTASQQWAEESGAGAIDFDLVDLPASRRTPKSSLQLTLTAAATRGDDKALVQQLVKLYDASGIVSRTTTGGTRASKAFTAAANAALTVQTLRQHEQMSATAAGGGVAAGNASVMPQTQAQHMLEAVLSVSKEFELLRATCDAASFTNSVRGSGEGAPRLLPAGVASQQRCAAAMRLTALESTLIPEQYWVSLRERSAPSTRQHSTANGHSKSSQSRQQGQQVTGGIGELPSVTRGIHGGSSCGYSPRPGSGPISPQSASTTQTPGLSVTSSHQQHEQNLQQSLGMTLRDDAETVRRASIVPCADLDDSEAAVGVNSITADGLVVFPAPRPTGRAQVYLLAETLDHMLSADPAWLTTLTDRDIAYAILPPAEHGRSGDASDINMTSSLGNVDREHTNALVDPEVQWKAGHAFEAYTRAAAHVLRIADIGLIEVVRQVGCHCVERGALLDTLRQTVMDVSMSQLRILAHAKERAYEEATARVAIREELTQMALELHAARATIREMEKQQQSAAAQEAVWREKAARLDELVERVHAKRKRYEIHSEDEHAWVLTELEKQMRHGASEALASIYEEKCRLAGLADTDGESDESDASASGMDNEELVGGYASDGDRLQMPTAFDATLDSETGALDADGEALLAGVTFGGNSNGTSSFLALSLDRSNCRELASRVKRGGRGGGRAAKWLDANPGAAAAAGITEAPSVEEARKRILEQRRAAATLYEQSHQLLCTLHEATEAMNAASAPLYDSVVLSKVSPAAAVASSRWASVARKIGAFERERAHRQRVFTVFCDWCERYQRQSRREQREARRIGVNETQPKSTAAAAAPADGGMTSSLRFPSQRIETLGDIHTNSGGGGGGFFVRSDSDSDVFGHAPGGHGRRSSGFSLCNQSAASFMSVGPSANSYTGDHIPNSARSGAANAQQSVRDARAEERGVEWLTSSNALTQLREIKYITAGDLVDMDVRDCTPSEVNMLFAPGFDFKAYLHPTWRPRAEIDIDGRVVSDATSLSKMNIVGVARRQSQSTHASTKGEWSLTLSDVVAMLQDVNATLREMTVRMRAIAESAILRKGAEPPIQPPARPEDPCPLCGRCDRQAGERTRRQQAWRQVAHEVQVRLDDLTERRQRAEAEREDARRDARRMRAEVENVKQQLHQLQQRVQRDMAEGAEMGSASSSTVVSGVSGSSPIRRRRSSGTTGQPRGIISRRASGPQTVHADGGATTPTSGGRSRARKVGMVVSPSAMKRNSDGTSRAGGQRRRPGSGTRTPARAEGTMRGSVDESDAGKEGGNAGKDHGDAGDARSPMRRGTLPPSAAAREREGGSSGG